MLFDVKTWKMYFISTKFSLFEIIEHLSTFTFTEIDTYFVLKVYVMTTISSILWFICFIKSELFSHISTHLVNPIIHRAKQEQICTLSTISLSTLNMCNRINHKRLNITGMFHIVSILHNKVSWNGTLHQTLFKRCLHSPGLITVTAAVMLV